MKVGLKGVCFLVGVQWEKDKSSLSRSRFRWILSEYPLQWDFSVRARFTESSVFTVGKSYSPNFHTVCPFSGRTLKLLLYRSGLQLRRSNFGARSRALWPQSWGGILESRCLRPQRSYNRWSSEAVSGSRITKKKHGRPSSWYLFRWRRCFCLRLSEFWCQFWVSC